MTITGYQQREIGHLQFKSVPMGMRNRQPFYWTRTADPRSAPSGWYQETGAGLLYLGESILEEA